MRFSTIAVSLLSGLSVFKGVVASPILPVTDVQVQKRQTIVEVVNDLKTSVVSHFHSPCYLSRVDAVRLDPLLLCETPM